MSVSKTFSQTNSHRARLLLTYEDTGEELSCSVRTVERFVAEGKLDRVGTGKLRRITYESILRYIERHRNEVA